MLCNDLVSLSNGIIKLALKALYDAAVRALTLLYLESEHYYDFVKPFQ